MTYQEHIERIENSHDVKEVAESVAFIKSWVADLELEVLHQEGLIRQSEEDCSRLRGSLANACVTIANTSYHDLLDSSAALQKENERWRESNKEMEEEVLTQAQQLITLQGNFDRTVANYKDRISNTFSEIDDLITSVDNISDFTSKKMRQYFKGMDAGLRMTLGVIGKNLNP